MWIAVSYLWIYWVAEAQIFLLVRAFPLSYQLLSEASYFFIILRYDLVYWVVLWGFCGGVVVVYSPF